MTFSSDLREYMADGVGIGPKPQALILMDFSIYQRAKLCSNLCSNREVAQ